MAEDPDEALKDRLGTALGKLTDTLATSHQLARDAERNIAQAHIDAAEAAPGVAVPPVEPPE